MTDSSIRIDVYQQIKIKVVSNNLSTVAPSNKVTIGCIGVGWQGTENMQSFLSLSDVQVVAVFSCSDL